MKSLLSLTLVVVLSFLSTSGAFSQEMTTAERYQHVTEQLHSKVLNESRSVVVQLPKSYHDSQDKKYPVIYRLDGAGNLTTMNAVLESLQSQNAAPEVIVVAIENTDRLRDFYPTVNQDPNGPVGYGGGGAKFLSFITEELMPLANSTPKCTTR